MQKDPHPIDDIYEFFKVNNLTERTPEEFTAFYRENENERANIYEFFKVNNLTDKSPEEFGKTYFTFEKKKNKLVRKILQKILQKLTRKKV